MAITNSLVPTTGTVIFSAAGEQAITTVIFCNNDSVSDTLLTVYAVPNGNVVGTETMILNSLSLPATETFVFDTEKLILSSGDNLVATSSVDRVVVATVSSVGL